MSLYKGWSSIKPIFYRKFNEQEWFENIEKYIHRRYWPIRERFISTIRYVELHPQNASTFSYEYSSLLRDIGSVFSSVLDGLVRGPEKNHDKRYNITDYIEFLSNEIENIENLSVELNEDYNKRFFFPFSCFVNSDSKFSWWDAYNAVKHTDIIGYRIGNLSNVLYSLSCVSALLSMISEAGHDQPLFKIGYYRGWKIDRETLESHYVFPCIGLPD